MDSKQQGEHNFSKFGRESFEFPWEQVRTTLKGNLGARRRNRGGNQSLFIELKLFIECSLMQNDGKICKQKINTLRTTIPS